jgi:GGDEF domain-containing protein
VTTSIGIAAFPSDGLDAETLLKSAVSAMYHAKELGGTPTSIGLPA